MFEQLFRPLLRPLTRLLLRTVPDADAWDRIPQSVPLKRFGLGSKRDFAWYFEGESLVAVESIDDLKTWLAGCTYIRDAELFHETDFWQHPATFERLRMGDCEDFALWTWRKLVRLGYRAEFVAGRSCRHDHHGRGHAWVVFEDGGKRYLFDPTVGRTGEMVRLLDEVRSQYVPEVSVDQAFKRYVFGGYLNQFRAHRKRSAAVATA